MSVISPTFVEDKAVETIFFCSNGHVQFPTNIISRQLIRQPPQSSAFCIWSDTKLCEIEKDRVLCEILFRLENPFNPGLLSQPLTLALQGVAYLTNLRCSVRCSDRLPWTFFFFWSYCGVRTSMSRLGLSKFTRNWYSKRSSLKW